MFNKIIISLENGKKFIIDAASNSKKNIYIKTATLNGQPFDRNFIKHAEITNGGILKLEMTDQPATNRGIKDGDKPFSLTKK